MQVKWRKAKKSICVIGLGYIGLPTAAMFASNGHKVLGYDVNERVVNALNEGKVTIEEPYLEDLVRQVVANGNLRASTAMEPCDVYIIAVPTPILANKGADMAYVRSGTEAVLPVLKKGDLVILESTSPPRSTLDIVVPILEKSGLNIGTDVLVAHSPERVIPGKILFELVENNRIVGGINQESSEVGKALYKSFVKGEIYLTDSTTAEMCKLMENTFRDVNIALANELAKLCTVMGINAWEVIEFSNKHPRVNIHQPGPGVGGHCLAVDPWFIVEKQPELAKIIKLARETNDSMPHHVFHMLEAATQVIENPAVCILGLTYKPNIDDMRESPIMELVELIHADKRYSLVLNDPYVFDNDEVISDIYEAVVEADILILGVHHDRYENLDFDRIKGLMKGNTIIDTRNYFDRQLLKEKGFNVILLGSGRQ
jgi:UDP-N-acetyl-D-mannosaminuronic acid dehydrogenase